MAYSSGTVTTAAGLVSAIQAFATINGWTVAGDYISKGDVYVHLWAESANEIRIQGARGGTWTAPDICARYAKLFFAGGYSWPASATYHLHYSGTPDTLWCTLNWDVVRWMHIGFGMLSKLGTWTGGQWFFATGCMQFGGNHLPGNPYSIQEHIDGLFQSYGGGGESPALPFWSSRDRNQYSGSDYSGKNSFVECALRGHIWEATGALNDAGDGNIIHCPTVITPTQKRSPNALNAQTILTPFDLYLRDTDGYYMAIGRPEHIRFVRLVNYNPGDTLTIGSDAWRVYPAYVLDATQPDGKLSCASGCTPSTGNLGIAVRYDP